MADSTRTVLIVGGGVAAARCALGLRARGFDGRVHMLSAESTPPYDRPSVSKQLLAGAGTEKLLLDPLEAYADAAIELELGVVAAGLDVAARRVELADGGHRSFDRLVIATGATPRLPAAFADAGALTVRDLRDGERLRDALDAGGRVAIVGAGFVGGEVASAAAARGLETTVIELQPTPLEGLLGAEVGARIAALHRDAGVRLLGGAGVASIARVPGGPSTLVLDDGRRVEAEVVVVGVGAAPDVAWLAGSGVELDGGVVTDERGCTNVPGVFAAGDCARWLSRRQGRLLRVEHWDTAGRFGEAVAGAVRGEEEPFDPVPFFWSDQHGVAHQWVGHAEGWDAVELEEAGDGRGYVARYRRGGVLAGVFAANQPRAIGAARRELARAAAG